MTSEAAIPYQVDTGFDGGRIDVHVYLPDVEGAVDYHWYVNPDAAKAQTEENTVFDVETASSFFGESGLGMNRRTVDRVVRMIDFDIIGQESPSPDPDLEPDGC